jgi:hypothetical protein
LLQREELGDRIVEVHLPALDELGDGKSDERLGDGTDAIQRMLGGRERL